MGEIRPAYHDIIDDLLERNEKLEAERDALVLSLREVYERRFLFAEINQCWWCGTIDGHGLTLTGKECPFRLLEATRKEVSDERPFQ